MNLKNGYKVLYEVLDTTDGTTKRVFKASKTNNIADAETILSVDAGTYKLVYEKDGKFYGSVEKVPTESDHCFTELDAIFAVAEAVETPDEIEPQTIDEVIKETEEIDSEEELPEADPEEV